MNSKLRFYLRGLGIGMAVTALILALVNLKNNHGEMTDAQIKERAAQLGMVEANSYSLTDAVGDKENTDTEAEREKEAEPETETEVKTDPETKAETEAQTNTETESETEAETETETKTETDTKAETETETDTETEAETETKTEPEETPGTQPVDNTEPQETEPEPEPAPVTEQTTPKEGTATITINGGSSSETACSILKNAGLIDNAEELNRYMIQHGYDRTIQPGTYTIAYGLSFEEICKKIAQ